MLLLFQKAPYSLLYMLSNNNKIEHIVHKIPTSKSKIQKLVTVHIIISTNIHIDVISNLKVNIKIAPNPISF